LLTRLIHNQKNWHFDLSFLFLRDVKGLRRNHKLSYLIDSENELNLKNYSKKRIVREASELLGVPCAINEVWSMAFMHDSLLDRRAYRLLNVIDDFNRGGLGIEIGFSVPSERVIAVWTRSLNGEASPRRCALTMGRSTSAKYCELGLRGFRSASSISSRAGRGRMPMLISPTEPCVTAGAINTCTQRSVRSGNMQRAGSGWIITNTDMA